MNSKLASLIIACHCVVTLAAPINPENPPQGLFSDEWSEIYFGGNKVGYAHSMMSRDGESIQSKTSFHMRMGRDEQPVTIDVSQFTTETLAGGPISFGSEMDMSVMKSATKGTVKDGKVTIVTSQYGMDQTQTFDYPAGALLNGWGIFRESLKRGFKPGTTYTTASYSPELRLDGAITADTVVGDWETFDHRGKPTKGRKVTVTLHAPAGDMQMVSWVDADGIPLKAKVPVPGLGDIEMLTVEQGVALADFAPPEFFNNTVVPANRKIDRGKVNSIKYRITSKKPDMKLGDLPTTELQKITAKSDQSVELQVSRVPHKPQSSSPTPETPSQSLSEYLESNLMINTADEKLIALAKLAAGDEKDPFKLADKLRKFVTDYVTTKSLNIGFATASEVARTREGDCSEHGVLLAALGRINGIPSRVAVGLAYVPIFGRQDDIFGYHMWTQFHLDGRWIDVDAALRETDVSPARLTFAVSSLKNAGLADLSLPLLTLIGAIDIDILSVD